MTILHVDMDAFFASIEQSRHPEWRGKPVIVGSGPHERGVVSTCSYEARKFGVHSAMPSRTAYELCPQAIFTYPDMPAYQEVSDRAFEVFSSFSPYVEAVSVDEAFIDITGSIHLYGTAKQLGEALRSAVFKACSVTCSVGIASNRLMAKIGSEQHKPNGLTLMPTEPDAIAAFLAPQPIDILWGIGKRTTEMLRPYGITTCGDLQRTPYKKISAILGEAAGTQLSAMAFGRSEEYVYWEDAEDKSVSREHTFDIDECDRERVREKLLDLVADVGRRFRTKRRWARTARLKLRDAAFNTVTRQTSFERPSRDDLSFRKKALELFSQERISSIRLIGFGVTNFQDHDAGESMLFDDDLDVRRKKHEKLSEALDRLHEQGLFP